jgi:lysophospholipase L1-like esterase
MNKQDLTMTARSQGYSKIVAYGDSITQGHQTPKHQIWTALLSEQLRQAMGDHAPQIINAGVGGNTSGEGLARFEKDVLPHLPALVLVEFGGNDATWKLERHLSPETCQANLHTIHRKITEQQGRVIFMSFPPIVNKMHPWGDHPMYEKAGGLDEMIQPYRDRTRQTARTLGCDFFDLDKVLRDAITQHGPARFLEADGVHLTPQGHELVAKALTTFLAPLL